MKLQCINGIHRGSLLPRNIDQDALDFKSLLKVNGKLDTRIQGLQSVGNKCKILRPFPPAKKTTGEVVERNDISKVDSGGGKLLAP